MIETVRKIKVVKRGEAVEPSADQYIRSHELSLLSLLIDKYPSKAQEFIDKVKRQTAPEASNAVN